MHTTPIILLLVIASCSFFACDGPPMMPKEKPTSEKPVIQIDTIFLGYVFGMTEEEFRLHTKALLKQGDVYGKNGMVTYDFEMDNDIVFQGVYSPDYTNEKLSGISIAVTSNHSLVSSPTLVSMRLAVIYMDKYGKMTKSPGTIDSDCDNYEWEVGNLSVRIFCGFNDVRIIYTNKDVEEKEDKKADTIKDI